MIYKPLFAQLELTENCTHSCIYCYNPYFKKREKTMVNDNVLEVISKSGLFYLTLTGGEPLIYPKKVIKALSILNESNMDVSINSKFSPSLTQLKIL